MLFKYANNTHKKIKLTDTIELMPHEALTTDQILNDKVARLVSMGLISATPQAGSSNKIVNKGVDAANAIAERRNRMRKLEQANRAKQLAALKIKEIDTSGKPMKANSATLKTTTNTKGK